MTDLKFKREDYERKWIDCAKVYVVWDEAQRRLKMPRAEKIAENFDPDLFDDVVVTLPNGHGIYHPIDGQTRAAAARIALGEGQKIPCRVIPVAGPKRAAKIFRGVNNNRTAVSQVDDFSVAVTEGSEMQVAIKELLDVMGYEVSESKGEHKISAPAACIKICSRWDLDVLREVLENIQRVWGFDADSVDNRILMLMAEFVGQHRHNYKRDVLTAVLRRRFKAATNLRTYAKNEQEVHGGTLARAGKMLLESLYNNSSKIKTADRL